MLLNMTVKTDNTRAVWLMTLEETVSLNHH